MPRQNFRSRGESLPGDAIDLGIEPKTSNYQSQQPKT
jgi:hypothetical protein